jgi:tRNA A-37 threonylcarbamoyl transferase component Bud32
MIGSQLGNYRVISRLGEGGMGTVYRATDTMLDRDVALKVLRPELARQAELVERFRAEAVALARLRHEHIAALYGLDRQGDDLVMVMEYVSGETLEARLARLGPMSWTEVVSVMRGVLAALGHAHVRGVVHRDIKPANVMIDGDGTVKVMDFGIARLMGENRQTRAGVAIGTPSYMAPEQLRGEDVDGRTDLYAAGALLFELITGRVAFQADSDYSLMMQQLNEPPPAPSTIVPGVPRALDAAVSRAMAKKPAQRFASATDFARVLDEITADSFSVEPIRGAAAAVAARAPRDWRVYVIAACVLAAAGLGAAALRSANDGGGQGSASSADTAQTPVPVASVPTAPTTAELAAREVETLARGSLISDSAGRVRAPEPITEAPKKPAENNATPPRTARTRDTEKPPERARDSTPPRDVRKQVDAPPVTPEKKEEPVREPESGGSSAGARRLESLASACVNAIASNNGAAAARLLRGDASGIISAVNDGRIQSAAGGNVSVNMGDGRGEGSFSVSISWTRAFGGAKSGTARLTAEVSQSNGGWSGLGCRVENSGGVR